MSDEGWAKVLKNQIELGQGEVPFFVNKCIFNKVFHTILKKYANKFDNPLILEAGCGTAVDSVYLSHFFHNVEAIDNDDEVVELAKKINTLFLGNAKIYNKDLFDVGVYDIIFNAGTYEHFCKEDIIKVLSLHLDKADYVIFSVPTNTGVDDEKTVKGDELLMSFREWSKIIKEADGEIVESFGSKFKFRPLRIAQYSIFLSKLFKLFGSELIFVIKKKEEEENG